MDAYATTISEKFSANIVKKYFQRSVSPMITNSDYEGEIKGTASKLHILTFGELALRTFTGSDMTSPDDPQESVGELITDQLKAYYFKIPSLSKFYSWIKNPEGTLLDTLAKTTNAEIDAYNLGFYTDVAAGQRSGTDFTTGTCTVANTTGVVTHSGTGFTSSMVGKAFKATGHTKWYRITAYNSTSEIVISNDSDDDTRVYDGGAIAGGTAFTIQANTAIQVAKSSLYDKIITLKTYLDQAEIPATDRFLVMPSDISNLLLSPDAANPVIASGVPEAYRGKVENGFVTRVGGFDIYQSEQVTGDATNGYHCLGGHKSAITHAMGMVETGIEDLKANFGKAYKGLTVYGSKVVDERRKALVEGYWKL